MSSAVASCYSIEKAIKELLESKNSPMVFKSIDVHSVVASLTQPGFTVAVTSGKYEEVNNTNKLDEVVDVTVELIFKNVASEEQRRMVAHPAVRYVVQKLHKNDLGLEIEPLTAKGWDEVERDSFRQVALTVFEMKFATQFTITPESAEENYRELLSIGTTFQSEIPEHETLMQGNVIFKEVNNEPVP